MSRRESANRPSRDKRPSRVVLKSLDVPKCSSAQIKICSQPRPAPQPGTPPSESPSAAEFYQELYSTSQSCNNSESCIQKRPDECLRGQKAGNRDDSQRTKRYQSYQDKKGSTTGCKQTNKAANESVKPKCPKYTSSCRSSTSLASELASTLEHIHCANNDFSLANSPDRSPCFPCSPRRTSIQPEQMPNDMPTCAGVPLRSTSTTASQRADIQRGLLKRPTHEPTEENSPCGGACCIENEENASRRGRADAGTYPIPDTAATGCMTKCFSREPSSGNIDCESASEQEECSISPCSRKPLPCSPKTSERCCAPPESAFKPTNPCSKGASHKPSLKQNQGCKCSGPSKDNMNEKKDCACCKQSTDNMNNKKQYMCPGMVKPPLNTTCTCHFPPAFYKYGCTGNISGNCNCSGN